MSIEVHALRRMAISEESTFATDITGGGNWLDIPAQTGSMQLTLEKDQLETQELQQYMHGYPDTVIGPARATLTFTMVLAPDGNAAGEATSTLSKTSSGLYALLDMGFGGLGADGNGLTETGSAVATATSAQVFVVDASDGSKFIAGGAVGVSPNGGTYQLREIQGVSTDTVTLKEALSASVAISDVVYNTVTVYPEEDHNTSAQFLVQGAEGDDAWLLLGGQMTSAPSISLPLGQLPTISFTFTFANWTTASTGQRDAVFGSSGGGLEAATYSNWSPTYVTGEFFAVEVGTGDTTAPTCLDVSDVSLTLNGPSFAPVPSPCGTNTVARWRMNHAAPFATLTMTLPYEDTTWFTARDNGTSYYIQYQIGQTAGGSIAIALPTALCTDAQLVESGGLAYQTVTFRAQHDEDATDKTTAWRRAPFRLHFG